ncbi:13578_t:CDS:2, partial [Racocetra fulgida]
MLQKLWTIADGVVLAVEKLVQSKLLVPRSNRRIQTVDTHIGVQLHFAHKQATAGLLADGHYAQAYTLYSNVRPFGSSAIIGTVDKEGPQLFMVEPSGVYWVAKTEIEKLKLAEMSVLDAVKETARIIYTVHDEAKDKEFELELSWITEENRRHQFVPDDIAAEAERLAK